MTWLSCAILALDLLGGRDPTGTTTYGYDSLGYVDSVERVYDSGVAAAYSFVNDLDGRVLSTTTPTGTLFEVEYDYGRPTRLFQGGTEIAALTYDGRGKPERMSSTTGAWWEVQYLTSGLPDRIDFGHGATSDWRDYGWKKNGLMASAAQAAGTSTFTYDAKMRLSGVNGRNPESFTWDAAGNPVGTTDWTGSAWTYTPGVGNQIDRRTNGSVTLQYVWDAAGRVESTDDGTNTRTFEYDGLGRLRVFSENGIVRSVTDWDGEGAVVRRVQGDPADPFAPIVYTFRDWSLREPMHRTREEFSLGGIALGDIEGGVRRWFFSEVGGHVATVTDDTGTILGTRALSVFGSAIARAGIPPAMRALHGQVHDGPSDTFIVGARHLSVGEGQFLQPDPVLLEQISGDALVDPLRLNPYRFARGAPTTFGDSSGEFVDVLVDVAFIAYDLYALYKEPSATNVVALGADVGCAIVPGLVGGGMGVRTVRVATHTDDVARVATAVGKLDNVAEVGARGVTEAGEGASKAGASKAGASKAGASRAGAASFPTAEKLAERLGVGAKQFHKDIKPGIVRDFAAEAKKIGAKNPDIGVNEAGNIVLRNPQTGAEIATDVPLDAYTP